MRPKCLPPLVALALVLSACSGGDDDAAAPTTIGVPGDCPVAAAVVAAAVAHAVTIEHTTSEGSCAYVGAGEDATGGRVEIVVRSLADEAFGSVRAEVERRSGPTVLLPQGLVDGADRGWIATVGRAVQIGAANGETLVLVAVTDPLLDAEAAQGVAADLAGEALPG